MTTPDINPERAPIAPVGGEDTLDFPRPPAVAPRQGLSSSGHPDAETAPSMAAVEADRAEHAAGQAQAAADEARARARAPRAWPMPVRPNVTRVREYIRDHRGETAGAVAVVALAAALAGGLIDHFFLNGEAYETNKGNPTGTSGQLSGGEFACSPAADMGGFPNGATIDTTGKGGAIVDDTQPGQKTQVAVIPAGQVVQINGAVHEWLYNADCTPGQIQKQAQDHAKAADDTYVSNFHDLSGVGKIPTLDARIQATMSERIAQRTADRLIQSQPLWRRLGR